MWWEICIQEAMKYNCSVFIVPACIMWWEICIQEAMKYNCSVFIVPACIMWWVICIQEAMKYNCSVFIVPACIMCVAMVVADYDAPVAENGDLTEKYFIIKKVLHEMLPSAEGLFMSLFVFCYQLAPVKIKLFSVMFFRSHFIFTHKLCICWACQSSLSPASFSSPANERPALRCGRVAVHFMHFTLLSTLRLICCELSEKINVWICRSWS